MGEYVCEMFIHDIMHNGKYHTLTCTQKDTINYRKSNQAKDDYYFSEQSSDTDEFVFCFCLEIFY